MQCNVLDEADKIDVLYGSAEPAQTRRVREHLSACSRCREEMAALEGTRERLSLWTLPDAARPEPARRVQHFWVPLAAAVLLALGAGLFLRGSELRYQDGRFSFRLGPGAEPSLRQELAEQDARHQREIAALKASLVQPTSMATALQPSDVQAWIRESEVRQSQQLQARIAEVKEKAESQRRLDMARVSAGLSYLDGKNGQHVARTSELMNYMLQASYKR
jgi:hypothetical protein